LKGLVKLKIQLSKVRNYVLEMEGSGKTYCTQLPQTIKNATTEASREMLLLFFGNSGMG